MTPMVRPRQTAICSSLRVCTAVLSTSTWPEVGRSMPVITLISVDLPLPDFPTMDMNLPASTCKSMPLSAVKLPASLS